MLVNHFGELRSDGGSLVIVLCTCNERRDEVVVGTYEMAMGPC